MVSMFIFLCAPICAAQTIQVTVNDSSTTIKLDGKALNFSTGPVIKEGRMLVPFRDFAEQLGYQVEWDQQQKKVTIIREIINGEKQVVLWVGDNHAVIMDSGKEKDVILDVPPTIIQGRTMVPVRFIGESMGCEVKYERAVTSNVVQPKSLPNSGFLQEPYAVSNSLNNVTFPAGTPTEFVKIAERLDIDDKNSYEGAIMGEVFFYSVEYYPGDEYFHIAITKFGESERKVIKEMLKVFFPTGYEKVFGYLVDVFNQGDKGNFNYKIESTKNKPIVIDGRRFILCNGTETALVIDLGVKE